jgi:hypothetical protein
MEMHVPLQNDSSNFFDCVPRSVENVCVRGYVTYVPRLYAIRSYVYVVASKYETKLENSKLFWTKKNFIFKSLGLY